jgi:hypothetical protein
MKRQLVVLSLMLGAACAASAQEAAPDSQPANNNALAVFSAVPSSSLNLFQPDAGLALFPAASFAVPPAFATPLAIPAPDPSPSPAPDPKFLYGGRDDFRWQLGIGVDWLRFRNSIFNASAIGVKSSVTYFTNDWFGIEGNVSATFAPEILDREHVKVLVYGGGPKIAWREKNGNPGHTPSSVEATSSRRLPATARTHLQFRLEAERTIASIRAFRDDWKPIGCTRTISARLRTILS